jgi:hypothetical protein
MLLFLDSSLLWFQLTQLVFANIPSLLIRDPVIFSTPCRMRLSLHSADKVNDRLRAFSIIL